MFIASGDRCLNGIITDVLLSIFTDEIRLISSVLFRMSLLRIILSSCFCKNRLLCVVFIIIPDNIILEIKHSGSVENIVESNSVHL